MKNFWKAIGKATLYFLVYFGLQMAVSMVSVIVISMGTTMQLMATGEEIDQALLTEQLTAQVYENAMLMTFISGVLALLVFWLVFVIRKKNFFEEVQLCGFLAKGIVPIIVLGVSFNVVISVIISVIPFPQSWIDSYASNSSVISDGNTIIAWIATVLLAPVLEEITFRGLMYTRLKKGMNSIIAAGITSLVFGLMHGTIIWGMYAFVLSIVLIYVFERFHSLAANMLLHFSFNLTGMGLSLIADQTTLVLIVEIVSFILFVAMLIVIHRMTKIENL